MPASPASSSRAAARRRPAGMPAVCGAARSRQRRTAGRTPRTRRHPSARLGAASWWPWQSYDNGTASCRRAHDAAWSMTTTLITGANEGLGKETARQLVVAGHTVYVGARDQAVAVGGRRDRRRFVQLDVTDDASVAAAFLQIEADAGLDVLVNNAGIGCCAQRPGRAAGIRHQCRRHHPGHRGGAPAPAEVREPGRGQRLQRARLVLGRHQALAARLPGPGHRLRREQGGRLDAHGPVREGRTGGEVQRGRARLHRDRARRGADSRRGRSRSAPGTSSAWPRSARTGPLGRSRRTTASWAGEAGVGEVRRAAPLLLAGPAGYAGSAS